MSGRIVVVMPRESGASTIMGPGEAQTGRDNGIIHICG